VSELAPDAALGVIAGLLRRLRVAAGESFRSLACSRGEQVLLHQDLHADNVLRAEREPWLAT
jgi:streptomycin 6-kinase